jgi:hypothetical protein
MGQGVIAKLEVFGTNMDRYMNIPYTFTPKRVHSMPEHSKKTHKTTGTRDDVAISRADPSTYISKIDRPNLQDRERHVIEGFKRGLSLESLIRNSGYPVRTIFSIIGRDPLENPDEFNRLETFKANLLTHKV